jgi:NADH:ubiquinone oxidoreductase subunit 4 (subunit M)
VPDYGRRELATMLLMVALLIWLGVNPQPLLELTQPAVDSLLPGAAP